MKTLTKKQRGEIYLKVAERLETRSYSTEFLCWNLCDEYGTPRMHFHAEARFDEFRLFREHDNEYDNWIFENNDERIICMLLCAEMSKDGK